MAQIATNLTWKEGELCEAGFGNVNPIKVTSKSGLEKYKGSWSPLHLLVSAAEACFLITFLTIAERSHVQIAGYESTAEGTFDSDDGKHFAIKSVTIKPKVRLVNETDQARLATLFEKAEEYCPVSNSLNFKVNIA